MSDITPYPMFSDRMHVPNGPPADAGRRPHEEVVDQHFPEDFTIRDEANTLVAWAFRNGPIENLHAGKYSPLLEDPQLSRITNAEMKALMLNACRQLAKLLELKESNPAEYAWRIMAYNDDYCRSWER
jgi:hypothetical protein